MSSLQHIPNSATEQQSQIDSKIKEVKRLQEELQHLSIAIPEAVSAYQKAIAPIAEKICLLKKEKLISLDIYIHEIKFSKRELAEIDTYMTAEIEQWLHENGTDQELKDLFITYAHISFEEYMKQFRSADDFIEEDITEKEFTQYSKKKTAAERKIEKEKQILEQHRKKSIRAIYIDLIKAFHPDTELNEEKKAAKEEISKKITEAYSNNDLYTLLNLETQFLEQQTHRLQEMKKETATSYLAMLESQIKELTQCIRDLKSRHDSVFIEMCKPNAKPDKFLRKVKKELQEGIQILSRQIIILQHVDPGIKSDLLSEMERQNEQRR